MDYSEMGHVSPDLSGLHTQQISDCWVRYIPSPKKVQLEHQNVGICSFFAPKELPIFTDHSE